MTKKEKFDFQLIFRNKREMTDTIIYIIVIAMGVNTITSIPLYAYLDKLGKPFSCVFCLSFWVCILIGMFNLQPLPIAHWLIVTLSAPYMADIMERIKNVLPIRIK